MTILLLDVVIDLIRALVAEPVLRGLDMDTIALILDHKEDLEDTIHLMNPEDIIVTDHIDHTDPIVHTDHIDRITATEEVDTFSLEEERPSDNS